MVGGPNGPGLTPQKTLIFGEKMLRLLEFFGGKNSSPIFSKLVRARDSNPFIHLVGTIKPYNLYYQHWIDYSILTSFFAMVGLVLFDREIAVGSFFFAR